MGAPIQPVTAFAEAELWYMYQQLVEIQGNTSLSAGGLTQDELFEVFNGTNTQGKAVSLFETVTGTNISLSNIEYNSYIKLISIDTNQVTSNGYLNTIDSNTQVVGTNTTSIATYLSTIRTPVIISTSASATISAQLHNVSFYNSGSSAGTITVNGTTVNLPAGVTVNYDAGGNNNRFPINIFSYNATGTTFLISYVN